MSSSSLSLSEKEGEECWPAAQERMAKKYTPRADHCLGAARLGFWLRLCQQPVRRLSDPPSVSPPLSRSWTRSLLASHEIWGLLQKPQFDYSDFCYHLLGTGEDVEKAGPMGAMGGSADWGSCWEHSMQGPQPVKSRTCHMTQQSRLWVYSPKYRKQGLKSLCACPYS